MLEIKQGQTKGGGGQNLGILGERTFWMSPKPYIDMNIKLRKSKNWLWERLFQVDEQIGFLENYGKSEKTLKL